MVKAGWQGLKCVLLPLQSTNEQMHAIRMIAIGRHKQPAMDIWLLQEHALTNRANKFATKTQSEFKYCTVPQFKHDGRYSVRDLPMVKHTHTHTHTHTHNYGLYMCT